MVKFEREFIIEDMGKQECYVYDLETMEHNFFANDILVHNSVYVDISPFSKGKVSKKFDAWDRNKKIDFYNYVCSQIEEKAIKPCFNNLGKSLNLYSTDNLVMKREHIAAGINNAKKCGFWTAKKHYVLLTDDAEGVRYDKSHMKSMGLCYVQTIYAQFFRERMKEACRILVEEGPAKTREYIKNVSEETKKQSIADLSLIRGVSDVMKYTDENGLPKKGAGVHIRAAIYYNNLIKRLGLEKKYDIVKNGAKVRFVYLKDNKYHFDVIAFHDELPEEFELNEFIDYDTILEKSFLSPLRDIFTVNKLDFEEKFEIEDLFG